MRKVKIVQHNIRLKEADEPGDRCELNVLEARMKITTGEPTVPVGRQTVITFRFSRYEGVNEVYENLEENESIQFSMHKEGELVPTFFDGMKAATTSLPELLKEYNFKPKHLEDIVKILSAAIY